VGKNSESCITVGPVTRTADILAYNCVAKIIWSGSVYLCLSDIWQVAAHCNVLKLCIVQSSWGGDIVLVMS